MISRFEHKYFIHARDAEQLMDRLRHRLRRDTHAVGQRAPIVSLYFDSPQLDFYNDKIEGEKFRQKFRLRWYPEPHKPVERVWVEIKRKHNNTINKSRHAITAADAQCLIDGNLSPLDDAPPEFSFVARRHQLRSSALISYHREAWLAVAREPLRITVDYLTHTCRPPTNNVFATQGNKVLFDPAQVILEIKTAADLPGWLMREIRQCDTTTQSISKYCSAITALYPWHHCVKLIRT